MNQEKVKIADLDKIVSRKYYFTLHGKEHEIDPPALGDWLEIVESGNKLWALKDKEKASRDEVVDSYFSLISKVCKTITREDILSAKQWQLTALWQLSLDMMNGYEEKKTLTSMMLMGLKKEEITKMLLILNQLLSMHQDSSPISAEASLDGH